MNRTLMKNGLLVGATVFLAIASPVAANARDGQVHDMQQTTEESHSPEVSNETEDVKGVEHESTTQRMGADRKEAIHAKLADNKLKMCQDRQKTITNITSRIADRGQKQVDLFSKIAERTESFYVNKGKTLATYDTLVADVTAKKEAAQSVVDTVVSGSVTFDCSSDNPKGSMSSFKDSLKSEIEVIKAYKTSVKNLIVGVKSVQGTTSSEKEVQQ